MHVSSNQSISLNKTHCKLLKCKHKRYDFIIIRSIFKINLHNVSNCTSVPMKDLQLSQQAHRSDNALVVKSLYRNDGKVQNRTEGTKLFLTRIFL